MSRGHGKEEEEGEGWQKRVRKWTKRKGSSLCTVPKCAS